MRHTPRWPTASRLGLPESALVINREIKRMVYDAGTQSFTVGTRNGSGEWYRDVPVRAERSVSVHVRSLREHDDLTHDAP